MNPIFISSENSKTSDHTDHYSIFQKNLKKSDKYVTLSNHKKHEKGADNPPIKVFLNKLESRITFTVKTGYCLELLTPETMKLIASTKYMITKCKHGENVPYLEINKVLLL